MGKRKTYEPESTVHEYAEDNRINDLLCEIWPHKTTIVSQLSMSFCILLATLNKFWRNEVRSYLSNPYDEAHWHLNFFEIWKVLEDNDLPEPRLTLPIQRRFAIDSAKRTKLSKPFYKRYGTLTHFMKAEFVHLFQPQYQLLIALDSDDWGSFNSMLFKSDPIFLGNVKIQNELWWVEILRKILNVGGGAKHRLRSYPHKIIFRITKLVEDAYPHRKKVLNNFHIFSDTKPFTTQDFITSDLSTNLYLMVPIWRRLYYNTTKNEEQIYNELNNFFKESKVDPSNCLYVFCRFLLRTKHCFSDSFLSAMVRVIFKSPLSCWWNPSKIVEERTTIDFSLKPPEALGKRLFTFNNLHPTHIEKILNYFVYPITYDFFGLSSVLRLFYSSTLLLTKVCVLVRLATAWEHAKKFTRTTHSFKHDLLVFHRSWSKFQSNDVSQVTTDHLEEVLKRFDGRHWLGVFKFIEDHNLKARITFDSEKLE